MGTLSLGRLVIRPLSRLGTHCTDFFLDMWSLDRERRALHRLDDRGLKDIGLTRADVEGELAKPLWRR
jgi:uncharacterized protein YjiS (DUF1127 family)